MTEINKEFTGELVETWTPESESFCVAAQYIKEKAKNNPEFCTDITEESVNVSNIDGVNMLSGIAVDRHTDDHSYPRWTILFVVESNQHSIKSANFGEDFEPDCEEDETIEMHPGNLIILDIHRAHWVEAGPEGPSLEGYQEILDNLLSSEDEDVWGRRQKEASELLKPHWFLVASTDMDVRPTREQAEEAMLNCLSKLNLEFSHAEHNGANFQP